MTPAFDATRAARYVADAHAARAPYQNLPPEIAPPTIADAYAAQEALARMWTPSLGPLAGLKIATTTKVMQDLMGIDHPCGGMIFQKRVHAAPARIAKADFIHLVIECELAVRLKTDLPPTGTPYTRDSVRRAIGSVMSAFELIEDRNAHYKSCKGASMIADNCWNGGIVLGAETPLDGPAASKELDRIAGRLEIDGRPAREGHTDDPLGALAWVANLAIERGRPMTAGMVVITGSLIPTLPIEPGSTFSFAIDGLAPVVMTAV